jgi:hypothetical protein
MRENFELVYSQQKTGFQEGRAYANPRFFNGRARMGVTKVVVIGNWPEVVSVYRKAGVPVEVVGVAPKFQEPAKRVIVEGTPIPDNWRELQWSRPNEDGMTLRGLAASLTDTPIINGQIAREVIEAELEKRCA